MKILATTDFHGDAEAFQRTALKATESYVDLVLLCGDITHFGSVEQAKELLSCLNEIEPPVLFVPGNCDPSTLTEEKVGTLTCIHGRCKQMNNTNFLGVGGSSPSPFDTPFEITEAEIAILLHQGLETCVGGEGVVLVSHSPPKNTIVDVTFRGDHVGSSSVREFIQKTKPMLVLCGHIHEAIGVDKINKSIIVNPGPAKQGHCAIIDLDRDVRVRLDHL